MSNTWNSYRFSAFQIFLLNLDTYQVPIKKTLFTLNDYRECGEKVEFIRYP